MQIGMTYDLRDEYLAAGYSEEETAEFDRADTIDAIENALRELGHRTDRIGSAKQLLTRLARGDRWELVFNICEGLNGLGREAQVPAMLDVYRIPYTFADPCVMSICLNKGVTKSIVLNAGLLTPRFVIVDEPMDFAAVSTLRFPLLAKPIAEGTGKGVSFNSKVHDTDELKRVCGHHLRRYAQPVLIEEFLPGREFTVGILGTGTRACCLGTFEIILLDQAEPEVYSYANKERCEELVEYRLVLATGDAQVQQAEEVALTAWRKLGCRDGGRIDLRCDAHGCPQFLEANPLAGLHPSHSDLPMIATALGMSYVELIRRIVDSAKCRCKSAIKGQSR
ncbi:MAG: D-alanine--D-alanine ligase [Pirellulales bacterium]|nr:D-alanine--D-alanine ligase [Pirellulales bacterium]